VEHTREVIMHDDAHAVDAVKHGAVSCEQFPFPIHTHTACSATASLQGEWRSDRY